MKPLIDIVVSRCLEGRLTIEEAVERTSLTRDEILRAMQKTLDRKEASEDLPSGRNVD